MISVRQYITKTISDLCMYLTYLPNVKFCGKLPPLDRFIANEDIKKKSHQRNKIDISARFLCSIKSFEII